ncbi:MAG: MFS transporter [Chloroflexota bacterium]
MRAEIQQNVRFNFTVNVLDGAFFGLSLGFASYVTIIPLFISTLTHSSVLIGLIAAMHTIGWQLPQLLTANRVARLRRYKPMVIFMTLNERVPFFALALVALAVPAIGREWALVLAFIFVTWQAMGGGLTGTAWQTMIAKIIPTDMRGTFYGMQSSAANLLSSGSAVLAGFILESGVNATSRFAASGGGVMLAGILPEASRNPQSFALCFFLAGVGMMVSMGFLNATRETDEPGMRETARTTSEFWRALGRIMRQDANFRTFIVARMLAQVASVGVAFYTVYAVRRFNMDAATAGLMTGVLLIAQVVANPFFGWLGDRYSHRLMFGFGVLLAGAAALLALFAPSLEWFYLVFALAGIANSGLWPTINALTVEFGSTEERPYYIGLANTLVAPATLLAPIIGGVLADSVGYGATFAVAAVCAVLTAVIMVFILREPRHEAAELIPTTPYLE